MLEKYRTLLQSITLATLSAIFGTFAGPAIEALAPPLFSPSNFPSVAFVIVTVSSITLAVYSTFLWKTNYDCQETIATEIGKISSVLGQQARLLPSEEAHKELRQWVLNAEKEIRVLVYYLYDWERGKDCYDSTLMKSDSRKALFDGFYETIQRTQNSNLQYIRIVEVPSAEAFVKAIKSDELYYRECKLLSEIGKRRPENASLRVSNIYIQNTFYLIDRTRLLLYIDIKNPDNNEYRIPFAMLVIDPTGKQLQQLVKLHQRIEAHSVLITDIE